MDHAAVLPPDVSERPVLVVRAPNLTEEARTSLRDYVVDSLRLGVLVVGPGVNYSLERFPQLGGVLCCGAEPAGKEEPEGPLPGQETVVAGQEELLREHAVFQPVINGRNAEEKRNILARLRAYRKAHGFGCLQEVDDKAGGEFTADLLRDMLIGSASPAISQWRKLGKALEQVETGEEVADGQSD